MFEIHHYLTSDGKDLIADWLRKLRDMQAKTAIIRRLNRLEQGNFGDFKPLRDGVHELRINVGPGYRFIMPNLERPYCCYYAVAPKKHKRLILLAHVLAGVIGKTVKIKGVQK